jgi:hypothetical protein
MELLVMLAITLALITLDVLALRYGYDSRELMRSNFSRLD